MIINKTNNNSIIDEAKKKKKPYNSITYTTGDIGLNIKHFNQQMGTDFNNPSTEETNSSLGGESQAPTQGSTGDTNTVATTGEGGLGESMELTEGRYRVKRYIKRYYMRPQNTFLSKKEDILRALAALDGKDTTIYSLKNLDDHDDITKLNNDDVIYYYKDGILLDKNKVKVLDYDLYVKDEEDRKKVDVDSLSDKEYDKVYDDKRRTERDDVDLNDVETGSYNTEEKPKDETKEPIDAEIEEESLNPFNLAFEDVNAYGRTLKEGKEFGGTCCICGEEFEGFGNNAEPYSKGVCCDACNQKFVIPLRLENGYSEVLDKNV